MFTSYRGLILLLTYMKSENCSNLFFLLTLVLSREHNTIQFCQANYIKNVPKKTVIYLYLSNYISQPFGAWIFMFDCFINFTFRNYTEYLGQIRVVGAQDNGIITVGRGKDQCYPANLKTSSDNRHSKDRTLVLCNVLLVLGHVHLTPAFCIPRENLL